MNTPRAAPGPQLNLSIVGLILALGLAALPLGHWFFLGNSIGERLAREAIWWLLGAAVMLWVVLVERQPLSSIGLSLPTFRSFIWGVAGAVLMIATVMLSYAVIFPLLGLKMNMAAVGNITHVPLWLQTATMARAGVVEEIIFRGYAIERIEALTGRKWLAGVVSATIFIAVHISSWGYAQLIVVAFGALILTTLYLWRRDLASNILAHFLTDLVGFMLARLQGA